MTFGSLHTFPSYSSANEISNNDVLSLNEKEDLEFIKNLFNDKIYRLAKQEIELFYENYKSGILIPDVIFIQAQINVVDKRFTEALQQYDKVINKYSKSAVVEDSLYFAGALRLQLNQREGLKYFETLLEQYPQSKYRPRANFHRGQLAFEDKNWEKAEFYFKDVLKSALISQDQLLQTQKHLAWIYYFKGNLILAKSMFFELLESKLPSEDKSKIAYQMGVDSQKKGQYRKAITWFERQMNEWPHPEFQDKSRYWIAESYYWDYKQNPEKSTIEDKEKSIRLYTENLSLTQPFAVKKSYYHRGWLRMALNRPDEAESDFAWLQENDPEYAADLELTATRASYFENLENLSDANLVYAESLNHQKEGEIRSMLLISLIRNSYRLKNCPEIIKWTYQSDLTDKNKNLAEISYYSGRCHFAEEDWDAAGVSFSRIPLETEYAGAIFSDYLEVFRQTEDFEGGIHYLRSVEDYPKFGDLNRILTLQIEFALYLEQYAQGLDVMLRASEEVAGKSKDPWFLLNIAKTSDLLISVIPNKNHPIYRYSVKSTKYYGQLALDSYQKALRYLPSDEGETKLSILDILIKRFQDKKDFKKVVILYRQAIKLIPATEKKSELHLLVAKILLKELNQKQEAQRELHKVHLKGNKSVHFEASSLLAELYVEQNKLVQAIKILEDFAKQSIKKTKWHPVVHFRLGELYQAQERWQKAVFHYDTVTASTQKSQLKNTAKERSTDIKKYLDQKKQQEAQTKNQTQG